MCHCARNILYTIPAEDSACAVFQSASRYSGASSLFVCSQVPCSKDWRRGQHVLYLLGAPVCIPSVRINCCEWLSGGVCQVGRRMVSHHIVPVLPQRQHWTVCCKSIVLYLSWPLAHRLLATFAHRLLACITRCLDFFVSY